MQSAVRDEDPPTPAAARAPARLLAVAICLAAVAAAVAPSASAHARLLRTTPPQGAFLRRAPSQSSFLFDQAVRSAAPARVSGGTLGGGVAAPARLELGGRRLVVSLPRLGRGSYAVRWRVVSDDGHLEVGTLTFGVGVAAAPAPAGASTATDHALTAARWAFLYGLLAAAGLAGASLALGLPPARRLRSALVPALLLCAAGAAGELARVPETLGTRSGLVTAAAGALALLAAALAAVPGLLGAACVAAVPLVAAEATAGHALSPGRPVAAAYAAELVHAAAAAGWLGLVLWALLHPRRREGLRVGVVAGVVVLLGASGVARAAAELTGAGQLLSTSYGRLLLAKTAIFAALVAVGTANRARLAALPLRAEAVLVAAAALVVAMLGSTTPPRDLPPPPPGPPVVFAREVGPYAVGVVARRPGGVAVTVLGQDGSPTRIPVSTRLDGRRLSVRVAGRELTAELPADPQPQRAAALVRDDGRAVRAARSLTIREHLASGPGHALDTVYRIVAPDRLAYSTSTGSAAVVVGARRWDRVSPRARWLESAQQPPLRLPVPDWVRAVDASVTGEGTVRGAPVWWLSFRDPTIPAWFEVALSKRTHRQLRVRMVAAAHFMTRDYEGFDAPTRIVPPRR